MAPWQAICALALGLAVAGAARAEESAAFNVSFGGIRAGVLAYRADQSGTSYTVNGSARASGLLRALFNEEIDTVAQGRVEGNTYRPRMAREVTVGGDTRKETRYDYGAGGVPVITRTPPRAAGRNAAPASQQGDTVDTTTAAYAILRDRSPALACKLDIAIFDGRRRHRIRLTQPEPTATGLICRGQYTREAGFSAKELAERAAWDLRLEYLRLPDGTLRVERLSFPTSFGTARVTRR